MALIVRDDGVLVDNSVVDMDFVAGLSVTLLTPGVVQIGIPSNGILSAMIADNAVITRTIADGAVTPAKLDRAYWQLTTPTTRPIQEAIFVILDGSVITNVTNATTSNFPSASGLTIPNDAQYSVGVDVSVVCQQSTNNNTCAVSFDLATDSGFANIILTSAELFNKRNDYATIDVGGLVPNRRNETLWVRAKVRMAGGSNGQVQSIVAKLIAFPQS